MIDQIKQALDLLNSIDPMSLGEPVPGKTYKADGWVCREIQWTPLRAYVEFIEIIGLENLLFLAGTRRQDKEGKVFARGQFLVSPEGMERLTEFVKRKKDSKND